MIDPTKITNYNRTEDELEEFLVFAILVAGKTAKTQAKKLEEFYTGRLEYGKVFNKYSLFEWINYLVHTNALTIEMKRYKLGQYKRLYKALSGILRFEGWLDEVSVEDLESVNGIGSKTARFFVLHSRKDVRHAVLDVHILKWLREITCLDIPKATPTKKKYAEIEKMFLIAADNRGMTPADLDLMIWKSFSQKTLA
jgi:thermostable 8-oxoguanine DNA glycosylase